MEVTKVKLSYFFTFFSIIIVIISGSIPYRVFAAASPIVVRQEITDPTDDWTLAPGSLQNDIVLANNILECMIWDENMEQYVFPSPDIQSVSYQSDGKTLNATLWLNSIGSNFKDPYAQGVSWFVKQYGMAIDIVSVYDAGNDYTSYVKWNSADETWTRLVQERNSIGTGRVVDIQPNYTGFFNQNNDIESKSTSEQDYVLLSFDLEKVNYPDQYQVYFTVSEAFRVNGRDCVVLDSTNGVSIPPPDHIVIASPSSLFLRPGEEQTVQLQIKTANTKQDSYVSFSAAKTDGIEVNFRPNETYVPSTGTTTSYVQVKASDNIKPQPYTLPIIANISFPGVVYTPQGDVHRSTASQNIVRNSNLTITVLPALRIEEHLSNFVNDWINPITGIWTLLAAIGAIIVPLLIRMYSKKHNKDKDKDKKLSNWFKPTK